MHAATHIRIAKVPVRREHVKLFLAYVGAVLMFFDFAWAMWGPHVEALEVMASTGGKAGAAMSGMAVFFERIVAKAL